MKEYSISCSFCSMVFDIFLVFGHWFFFLSTTANCQTKYEWSSNDISDFLCRSIKFLMSKWFCKMMMVKQKGRKDYGSSWSEKVDQWFIVKPLALCMKFFTAKKSNFFMLSLHECQNQFLFSIADRYRICFYDQCWSSFHFKTNWFLAWNCHKKFLYITELNYLQSRIDKTGWSKVWIFVMQLDCKKLQQM